MLLMYQGAEQPGVQDVELVGFVISNRAFITSIFLGTCRLRLPHRSLARGSQILVQGCWLLVSGFRFQR